MGWLPTDLGLVSSDAEFTGRFSLFRMPYLHGLQHSRHGTLHPAAQERFWSFAELLQLCQDTQ